MSQAVVDTKNTLRDVQAFARSLKSRLSDASDYMSMIQVPEGGVPSSDDMEILEMSLETMKEALGYSSQTTETIRADFNKIH